MSNFIDLIEQRFVRLLVIKQHGKNKDKRILWLCRCDCGNQTIVSGKLLRNNHTKSCGCLAKEGNNTTHGHLRDGKVSSMYRSWAHMIGRCNNPNRKDYHYYGGRGIRVCDRWRNSFKNFLVDMGHPPTDKHTLDRINNNKGYCTENCRWATMKEQCRNRRNNRLVTYQGKTQTLTDWAEETKIAYDTLRARLNRGWSTERTLSKLTRKIIP